MTPSLIEDFIQLIASHTGIQIRDRERIELVKKIGMRMAELKIATPESYYLLLRDGLAESKHNKSDREPSKVQEWEALTLLLTTGETYFFRDSGQLQLIQGTILPEIIARKQEAQRLSKTKPSLRIWSAGCSTGEEPYSLAAIVQELIPNYLNWNLLILGTDINTEAIAKARSARYSEWSFRMVKPEIKKRYFRQEHKNWLLDNRICRMVTLQTGNLLTDDYPSLSSDIYNMDIIICRNVFIYFNAENVETILDKFFRVLNPGGYLVVGHTELHDLNLKGFVPQAYEASVVYMRSEDIKHQQPSPLNSAILPVATPLVSKPINFKPKLQIQQPSQTHYPITPQPYNPAKLATAKVNTPLPIVENFSNTSTTSLDLEAIKTLLVDGNSTLDIQKAEQFLNQQPKNVEIIYLIAQSYADRAEYAKAIHYCEKAIALDPLSIKTNYLLAHIAEEKNNLSQAKEYLKRIIYIDELAIAAYLDLGFIYKAEGDTRRARKMFSTATELLEGMSPDAIVQYRGEAKVAELLEQARTNS
jgi:chemotaxis protein methyltransferase CheR